MHILLYFAKHKNLNKHKEKYPQFQLYPFGQRDQQIYNSRGKALKITWKTYRELAVSQTLA